MTKETKALADIRGLIANDAYAIAFQSLAQYRKALLTAIDLSAQPDNPDNERHSNKYIAGERVISKPGACITIKALTLTEKGREALTCGISGPIPGVTPQAKKTGRDLYREAYPSPEVPWCELSDEDQADWNAKAKEQA